MSVLENTSKSTFYKNLGIENNSKSENMSYILGSKNFKIKFISYVECKLANRFMFFNRRSVQWNMLPALFMF